MKIAVYAIFKNESKHALRWVHSCLGADFILALDTGSTDNTAEIIKEEAAALGIECVVPDSAVMPWRFDDARNISLNMLPRDIDIAVALDLDEILANGWRDKIEKAWESDPHTTRLRYNYVWSWNRDGTPGLTYHADKIHARAGYRWTNPVHEVLKLDPRAGEEVQTFINDTLILHFPDNSKPRTQYLDLMALAVKENPHDDRMAHYYGRELFFNSDYMAAIKYLTKHINMPEARWAAEKAASWRYIGDSYWELGEFDQAITSFLNANSTFQCRENWVRLAQAYRATEQWTYCAACCNNALEYTERPNSYINEPLAWSDWPNVMLKESETHLSKMRPKERAS